MVNYYYTFVTVITIIIAGSISWLLFEQVCTTIWHCNIFKIFFCSLKSFLLRVSRRGRQLSNNIDFVLTKQNILCFLCMLHMALSFCCWGTYANKIFLLQFKLPNTRYQANFYTFQCNSVLHICIRYLYIMLCIFASYHTILD